MSYVCMCRDMEEHYTMGCARRQSEYYRSNPQPAPPSAPSAPEPVRYNCCNCRDSEEHFLFKRCQSFSFSGFAGEG